MIAHILSYARPNPDGRFSGMVVGIYSSVEKLEEAKERLRQRSGFRHYPNGFYSNSYRVDEDYDDPMFFTQWDDPK
jgi:hypothetical protein